MKTLFLFFLALAFSQSLPGQSHKIEWFGQQTVGSEVTDISRVIADGSHYYMAVRPFRKFTDRLLKINKQGVIEIDEPLILDGQEHEIRLYGLTPSGGKLYGYYRVINGTNAAIMRDEINITTLKFSGHPVEVITGSVNPLDLLKPVWEKPERMDKGYFAGTLVPDNYAFIDFPEQDMHVILKRETYKGKENVDMKAIVIDGTLRTVNEGRIQLSSTNINTDLMDVLVDDKGGLYFITGDYLEKNPVCMLHYLSSENKNIQTYTIPFSAYIHEIKGVALSDGIMLIGRRAVDHKKDEYSLSSIKFSSDTKKITPENSLTETEYDRSDRLTIITDGKISGVFMQTYTPSSVDQNGNLGSRLTGDIDVYMLDGEGQLKWKKKIENYTVTPGGGVPCDTYYPFAYKNQFYLIHNTHPETPGLSAKGEKIKKATPGKDRFGTELITFGDNGELSRDFIYLREDKFVTIPRHTQNIGNGQYLLYADHATIGNSFMMGVLEIPN